MGRSSQRPDVDLRLPRLHRRWVRDTSGLAIEANFVSSFHPSVAWESHDGLWLVTYARDVPSGTGIFSRQVKPK